MMFPWRTGSRCAYAPLALVLVLVLVTALASSRLSAAVYSVSNAGNDGSGSLRQAILDANANPGPDAIHFAISGLGPHAIAPSTPLPAITDPVSLDGFTQPGASANTLSQGNNAQLHIVLSGQNIADPADGLAVATSNSLVRGLVLNRWTGNGLFVFGTSNVIQGNFIGTDVLGSSPLSNKLNGVLLAVASHSLVGGTAPAERNVISANGENGVFIASLPGVANRVEGNFIGVNAAGTAALGNGVYGVRVNYSSDNVIGGAAPGAGNLISGNLYGAIGVWYDTAATRIQGNLVGTDVTGLIAVPNLSGIGLNSNRGTLIGGSNAGEGNVVSGNPGGGIGINGGGLHRIEGNRIGTDATGTAALPNLDHGILIQSSTNNTIGGASAQARNIISGNGLAGIYIGTDGGTSSNNVIQGNFIGVDPSGAAAVANGTRFSYPGILLEGTSHNLIGGDLPEARNVISANLGHGVVIANPPSTGNVVKGNLIGTDATGASVLGNGGDGVRIDNAAATRVEQCQISGNSQHGVHILGSASVNNEVTDCSIGVFLDRPYSFGNLVDGVHIEQASNTTIHATSVAGSHGNGVILIGAPGTVITASRIGNVVDYPSGVATTRPVGNSSHGLFVAGSDSVRIDGNVIGPSAGHGVFLYASTTYDCVVAGNHIGMDSDGVTMMPNGLAGVSLWQASNNQIGALGPGDGPNVIAHNGAGVSVAGPLALNNAIRGNSIFSNTGLGIDLDASGIYADGPTPNDADDADEGPNHLQNFPVITLVLPGTLALTVAGSIESQPNSAYVLDFYGVEQPDASSQGKSIFGSVTVVTGANGRADFSALLPPLPAGWSGVCATATDDAGNTSEFSPLAEPVTPDQFSPPAIVLQPADVEVAAGAPAQFEAVATGLPPLAYQWRRNGVELPGQTAATLNLASAQLSDEGFYTVTVVNPLGEVTSRAARLTVNAAPVILEGPASQSIVQGGTARFEVKATGSAPLSYQWYYEDQPLAGQTAATLIISPAMTSHAGSYAVVVLNAFGAAPSAEATLDVVVPAAIDQAPTGVSVAPGQPAEFCVTATGSAPIRYQWRKNGVNIPQATQRCYTIASVSAADGGAYSVVVANDAGALSSDPVELVVTLPALVPGDDFDARVPVNATPSFRATNVGATKEPNELPHAGNAGGASVWFTWRAPASGVATFHTTGSSFDTLLAVYQGGSLGGLALVAEDEDQDGFLASRARFNAVADQDYEVAVDGFDGAMGAFTLSWEFEPTPERVPVITSQPQSVTVPMGGQATFEVAVDDPMVSYQWLFNGAEISGAHGPSYLVDSADREDVGYYSVRVTNPAGRTAQSVPAVLEIGPISSVQSRDKVPYPNFGSGGPGLSQLTSSGKGPGPGHPQASLSEGAILVGAGTTGSQILNNINSLRQPGEPNHCGRLGEATRWLVLRASTSGLEFSIDTQGSDIPTLLAVYSRADILSPLAEVACDRSETIAGTSARVVFGAQTGLDYWVAVDGVDGGQGVIQLNWTFGRLPALGVRAADATLALGSSLHWRVDITESVPSASVQWRRNGQDLSGQTAASLSLASLEAKDEGIYSVRLSSPFGTSEWDVGLIHIDTSARARAGSEFESWDEGWRVVGEDQSVAPVHLSPAGSQDGMVAHTTTGPPGLWSWAAPEPFLGNRSGAYGGRLEFELGKSPTLTRVDQEDVVLMGAGEILVFDLVLGPDGTMARYQVPLMEGAGWRLETRTGLPATQVQLLKVLGTLEALHIRASHSLEPHTTWLDSVRLVEPVQSDVSWLRARWLDAESIELEWPANAGAFQLVERRDLTPGPWTPVLIVPVQEDGFRRVRVPSAGSPGPRFYRLWRP